MQSYNLSNDMRETCGKCVQWLPMHAQKPRDKKNLLLILILINTLMKLILETL